MTTQLTTPVAKNAVSATVDSWHLELVRDPVTLAPIPDQSQFTVTVRLHFADGSEATKNVVGNALNGMPNAAVTAIRNFHNSIVAFMRNQGFLPTGVDTADI
jgi:hypothetical protein